jgi:hypothetical protein
LDTKYQIPISFRLPGREWEEAQSSRPDISLSKRMSGEGRPTSRST